MLDQRGRLLVLPCAEPGLESLGSWYDLPGGGLEPGETTAAAACRETAEETGVVLTPDTLAAAHWTRTTSFVHLGSMRTQRETVHLAELTVAPVLGPTAREEVERQLYGPPAWLTLAQLAGALCFPYALPAMVPRLQAGESVDSGVEDWNSLAVAHVARHGRVLLPGAPRSGAGGASVQAVSGSSGDRAGG